MKCVIFFVLQYIISSEPSLQAVGPVEELVVVRELGQHLGKMVDAAARNTLFITLFHPSSHDPRMPHKLRILSALVSLAIVTHNVSVLEATAVWMQVWKFPFYYLFLPFRLCQDLFFLVYLINFQKMRR